MGLLLEQARRARQSVRFLPFRRLRATLVRDEVAPLIVPNQWYHVVEIPLSGVTALGLSQNFASRQGTAVTGVRRWRSHRSTSERQDASAILSPSSVRPVSPACPPPRYGYDSNRSFLGISCNGSLATIEARMTRGAAGLHQKPGRAARSSVAANHWPGVHRLLTLEALNATVAQRKVASLGGVREMRKIPACLCTSSIKGAPTVPECRVHFLNCEDGRTRCKRPNSFPLRWRTNRDASPCCSQR